MADGEVRFEIRGDDSQLEDDLKRSEKKIRESAEDTGERREQISRQTEESVRKEQEETTEHHKRQNDERTRDDEETGKEREENEKSVAGNIKNAIKEQVESTPIGSAVSEWTEGFTGAKAAALGIGAAAVAVGAVAVNVADEMRTAMNSYMASTGISTEETERYQAVLEGIYANNYGEDFQDIADAMSQVDKQLGDMSDEALQNVTESAFALRDVFEYDIAESTRAAKAMMDNFGISGDAAMNLIAAGAQNGLDYSGELLDSISEYSVQFAKVGLDAEDMFKIFQKGADTGAWSLDKIGDAVKEMSIRVIDGSDATKAGFEAAGLNADEMAKKFAEGGESAREAFQETIKALAEMEDPIEQNNAGVALFGTMWEDLGPEVVSQLADITDTAYVAGDELEKMKDVKYDDLGSMLEGLTRNLELLLVPLGEMLIPILDVLIQSALPLITELLGPLMSAVLALISPILSLISMAIQPMIDIISLLIEMAILPLTEVINSLPEIFTGALESAGETVSRVISSVQGIFQGLTSFLSGVFIGDWRKAWEGAKQILSSAASAFGINSESIKKIFSGITDFVKGVFTGNWRQAWDGVKSIFSGICTAIGSIFKTPINAIIDGINTFIRGLNKIQIPSWVPGVGGKGFNISTIPRLKRGMDFVPADYYPAFLDYGERVLTAEQNAAFMRMGGLALLEQGNILGWSGFHSARDEAKTFIIHTHVDLDGKEVGNSLTEFIDQNLSYEEELKDRGC